MEACLQQGQNTFNCFEKRSCGNVSVLVLRDVRKRAWNGSLRGLKLDSPTKGTGNPKCRISAQIAQKNESMPYLHWAS